MASEAKQWYKTQVQITHACKYTQLEAREKLSRKTPRATDGRNSIIPATNRTIIKNNQKNSPAQINFIKVFKVVSHCFRNWIHLSSSNKGLVLQEQNEAALSWGPCGNYHLDPSCTAGSPAGTKISTGTKATGTHSSRGTQTSELPFLSLIWCSFAGLCSIADLEGLSAGVEFHTLSLHC